MMIPFILESAITEGRYWLYTGCMCATCPISSGTVCCWVVCDMSLFSDALLFVDLETSMEEISSTHFQSGQVIVQLVIEIKRARYPTVACISSSL